MRINKKTKKLIIATSAVIFSLAASTTGTYAWFATNMSVSASGMSITVYVDDTLVEYSVYKYDIARDTPVNINSSDAEIFVLNQYDVVFKERNKYNPIYVEIEVTSLAIQSSSSLTFSLERDSNAPTMDENDYLSEYFSSITRYAVATNGAIQGGIHDSSDIQNTWDNLNTVFYDRDTQGLLSAQVFTSGTTGNYVKQNSLVFNVNYSQNDFIDDSLFIYLYINYDEDLTELYSREHGLSAQALDGSTSYVLGNDLKSIHIEGNQ